MKISEYKNQTKILEEEFNRLCNEPDAEDIVIKLLDLFEAIEIRISDISFWNYYGLTDDDLVPEAPTKIIYQSFDVKC